MDTTADLLTRIRNAALARRGTIRAPWSKMSESLCQVLVKNGYLSAVSVVNVKTRKGSATKDLTIDLTYTADHLPAITGIKRISTPGHRQTVPASALPRVMQGYGMVVISTSKGLLSDKEARSAHLGGEVICSIW